MLLLALAAAWAAAPPPSIEEAPSTGLRNKKDAALLVAAEDFTSLPDATGARKDAAALRSWLVQSRGFDPTRVLAVDDPTASAAEDALERVVRSVKRGGTLWVYWAGHGAWADGDRVLLGVDASADAPADFGIKLRDLLATLEGSKARQIVVVLDVGFGGTGRDGEPLFPQADVPTPLPIRTDERVFVWSSTTADEPAYRYPANDHGLFSYFLVGALRGWADGQIGSAPDGKVSLQETQGYVARVVRQVGGGEQKPGKETRAAVNSWILGEALEPGPSKEELAALALMEKARRVKQAEEKLLKVARADWEVVSPTATTASAEAEAALKAFIMRYDAATVMVDGAQVAIAVPEVAEARRRLDEFAKAAAKATKKKKKKRTSARSTAPPPPPVATAACQDLLALEPAAITGELTPDQVACLESRIGEESALTTKDKLSRMLLVNADARGAVEEWTRLAARHLEDFDRSDPDLCFKFALVLSRGDLEDAELVLRWADYALENKHMWEGPTYMSRVYNLLRLKAETATRLWHDAEDDFIADRTEENELAAERYRGLAKDSSREWLDYARSSAQPFERAFVLCESASGNAAFCAPA
jgi:uncharacterized caspase-like protein